MKDKLKNKFYYIKQVEELIGRHRLTLRRWWKNNKFPPPIVIFNRLAWRVEIIDKWIDKIKRGYVPFELKDYIENKEKNMTQKESFESLPEELKTHLLYLKSIPGGLHRLSSLLKDIEEEKVKIIDSKIVEIN